MQYHSKVTKRTVFNFEISTDLFSGVNSLSEYDGPVGPISKLLQGHVTVHHYEVLEYSLPRERRGQIYSKNAGLPVEF